MQRKQSWGINGEYKNNQNSSQGILVIFFMITLSSVMSITYKELIIEIIPRKTREFNLLTGTYLSDLSTKI